MNMTVVKLRDNRFGGNALCFKKEQSDGIVFLVLFDIKAEFGEMRYKFVHAQGSDKAN